MWIGDPDKALRGAGQGLAIYGGFSLVYGVIALIVCLVSGWKELLTTFAVLGLAHGVIFGGLGLGFLRFYKKIKRLTSEKELCEQLMVDAEGLQKLAEQRNIKAKVKVNEEYLFDPNDFTEAGILLRPSIAPSTNPQELLRATNTSQSTKPDELLRPASTVKLEADITIDDDYLRRANQELNTEEEDKKPLFLRRDG